MKKPSGLINKKEPVNDVHTIMKYLNAIKEIIIMTNAMEPNVM